MLTQIFNIHFLILHGAKIEIMHSIAPVNCYLSINVTVVTWCPNICV